MREASTARPLRALLRARSPRAAWWACAACAILAMPASAQAAEANAALRLSVAVGPALPMGRAAQRWAELLREGGAPIAARLHPGASLAGRDPARELPALAEGRADLAVGSSLAWSMQVPALAVFTLPWIAPDDAQLAALAADAGLQAAFGARLATAGVTLVAVAPLGYREIGTTAKAIRAPEDLAGLRLRALPAPLVQETLLALGARPQTLPFAQAQAAFASGELDGQEGLPSSLAAARALAGAQRHVTDLGGLAEAMVFAVRTPVWDAWSPAQRQHARRAALQAIDETKALAREQDALRAIAAQGGAVLRLTGAGHAAFRAAAAPVTQRWRATVGEDVVARAEQVAAAHAPAAVTEAASPAPARAAPDARP